MFSFLQMTSSFSQLDVLEAKKQSVKVKSEQKHLEKFTYFWLTVWKVFNGKLNRRTPFLKCVCEIRRNKVLELYNASLNAQRENFFDGPKYTPLYKKVIKKTQKKSMETAIAMTGMEDK